MTHPEKYARPGIYRDDDRHEQLLDENREKYDIENLEALRDRRRRLDERIETLEQRVQR